MSEQERLQALRLRAAHLAESAGSESIQRSARFLYSLIDDIKKYEQELAQHQETLQQGRLHNGASPPDES